jgi:hypothetical protein
MYGAEQINEAWAKEYLRLYPDGIIRRDTIWEGEVNARVTSLTK